MRFSLPERLHLFVNRHRKALTLGVRVAVSDHDGGVFLVKHTYTPDWHLPGGGVELRETAIEAAARELDEEGGLRPDGPLELFGLYLNRAHTGRDHVAVFVCREWTRIRQPKVPNLEILDCRFFARDALPADTSAATRRRLAEIFDGVPPAADW